MGVKPIKALLFIAMLGSSVAEGQQSPPPLHKWVLPSSARVQGIGGTFFTTNLTVFSTEDAIVILKFLGNGIDGRQGREDLLLPHFGGTSKTYVDVLFSVFQLSEGFGAIQISSTSSSLNIVGQTSTPASGGGTYGQSV